MRVEGGKGGLLTGGKNVRLLALAGSELNRLWRLARVAGLINTGGIMAGRTPYNAFMAAVGGGDQPKQTAGDGRGEEGGGREPGRGFGGGRILAWTTLK